jgi:hypothetical protein
VSGRSTRESRRQALAEARRAAQRRQRRLKLAGWGGAAVIVAGGGIGLGLSLSGSRSAAPALPGHYVSLSTLGTLRADPPAGATGPENVPVPGVPALAGPSPNTTGQTIDAIACGTSEQTVFHVHTHLTIFVNGKARVIPYGVGIPGYQAVQTAQGPFVETGSCFYWLHTHAEDGIIHVESPSTSETFTLGQFFAEWGLPLSSTQVGPASGKLTVFFTAPGKKVGIYKGNPANLPLGSHYQIQIDVGTPIVKPVDITKWGEL